MGLENYVPLIVSMLSGLGTIAVVYFLGQRLFNSQAGMLAATILVVCPWHVDYSRVSTSYANSLFFYTLSILWYLKSRNDGDLKQQSSSPHESLAPGKIWTAVVSGIFLGLAFSCHYNLGLAPLLFLIFEIHLGLRIVFRLKILANKRLSKQTLWYLASRFGTRVFMLFMGMLLPLVCFNVVHIGLHYLGDVHIPSRPENSAVIFSYAQQIFIQLATSTEEIWKVPSDFDFWGRLLWNNLGGIACATFIFSTILFSVEWFRSKNIQGLILILPLMAYLIFVLNSKYLGAGRSLTLILPIIALLSAWIIQRFSHKFPVLAIAIPLVILIENFPILVSELQDNSAKNEVQTYFQEKKITSVILQGKQTIVLVDFPSDKIVLSPNLQWTRKQALKAVNSGQKIKPNFLLARFKPKELQTTYYCKPIKSWIPRSGRSERGFEIGDVSRNWLLTSKLDESKSIGLFEINDCFVDEEE
tara:strand:- start:189 stop:1604 length:1416 start_codon:yes stop_codon:yes gene_type:complete